MSRYSKGKPGPKPKLSDPRSFGKPLLSVEETAECFGLSKAVIYKMLSQNQIKHVKSGTRYLVPAWAIEEMITGKTAGLFYPVRELPQYMGEAS